LLSKNLSLTNLDTFVQIFIFFSLTNHPDTSVYWKIKNVA